MYRSLHFALAACALGAPLPASNVRVEYLDNGAIDVALPRFSYELSSPDRAVAQSAYRILIASVTADALVWDSGVVSSTATTGIAYAGAPLVSDASYNVSITWTDATGASAPPAFGAFSTGLFSQAEWAPADWIGCPLHAGATPNYNQLVRIATAQHTTQR